MERANEKFKQLDFIHFEDYIWHDGSALNAKVERCFADETSQCFEVKF